MPPTTPKPVAVIMGSQSDWSVMRHTAETLDALEIAHETLDRLGAPHRPDRLWDFARTAKAEGLPDRHRRRRRCRSPARHGGRDDAAARVRACRSRRRALGGRDSLYSIVQMAGRRAGRHPGRSGKAGAINAALLAAAVLALHDEALASRLAAWRAEKSAAVALVPAGRPDAVTLAP